MAPINPVRAYQQALTASVARTSRQTQDIVFNATPLTRILRDENRIREKRAGGPELRIPIEYEKLAAQWFTGYDKIQITPKEILNSAVFPWSRVVSMFSLNGTEMLFNSGEEEIIDLVEANIDNARKSAKEAFEAAIVGDGTADGGRQMIGFGGAIPILPNTGVYGGIDRATVPRWRTTSYNVTTDFAAPLGITTWDSTTARDIIEYATLQRSRNSNYADLWIFDAISYRSISASMVAHQRLATERSARLGYAGLAYQTPAGLVDLVAAGGIGNVMPANTAFGIDTKSLSFWEFPGQSFVPFHPAEGIRPINQDAIAQGIVWSGQMVVENPLSMIRLQTA